MKPTSAQITRANSWLDDRVEAYRKSGYFLVMPPALREAMNSGVDFSDVFAERGIAPNGVQLLPEFFDLNLRVR